MKTVFSHLFHENDTFRFLGGICSFLVLSSSLPAHDFSHWAGHGDEIFLWSEEATWHQPGFRVATCNDLECLCEPMFPIAGKSVTIPSGARVLLDVDTPVLNGVMIHGELIFADQAGVGLSAHWVMVMGENSALRIGSEEIPYLADTHITLYGTAIQENISGEASPWDSGTKFLMAMDGGTLALHGVSREKTSWTKLAAHAQPGDTSITLLDEDTGWQAGDRFAIGPSGFDYRDSMDFLITGVEGAVIHFTPPLSAAYWGELMDYDGEVVDQRAPVGLLTRNILIQGAGDSLLLRSEVPDFPGYGPYTDLPLDLPLNFGAHVMVMGGLDNRPTSFAYIEGVEFTRTGQQSLPGRYTFHWHWVGDASGQFFRNNSIHHAFQRAVNIHRSSGVEVEDNVAYKVFNHNYVWAEDGHFTEFDNRFRRNLALHVLRQNHREHPMAFGSRGTQPDRVGTGPNPTKQEEWRSSAFWGRNLPHLIEDNHAGGVMDGMGYFYDIGGGNHPEPRLHLFRFHNNTAHAVSDMHSGLNINNDLYPPAAVGSGLFLRNRNSGPLEFTGLNAFNNKLGVWLESNSHTIRDAILTDNAGAVMMFQGRVEDSLLVGITPNQIGEDELLVRGRSPRRINALQAESAGVFIFAGQGGQKSIKANNLRVFQTPGGAIRSNDIFAFHGSYFSGINLDEDTLPIRLSGLGEGAFLDLDGQFDPAGLGRPTWLTFGDVHYIGARSRFDGSKDAWVTPENGVIVRMNADELEPFGPVATNPVIVENGLGIELYGGGGVMLPLDYEVTPHTVIEFFGRDDQLYGKKNWNWVGIGLVNGEDYLAEPRLFGTHESRMPPFPAFSTDETMAYLKPTGGITPPGTAFRIPVGEYYTGPMSHLAFYGHGNGNNASQAIYRFHLIRIYEKDENYFRGWPVTREVYEQVPLADENRIFFSDLFNDPRFPDNPTSTLRVAPNYGGAAIHTYGNPALHERAIHRQHMAAAMVDHSYLVVDESGEYTFTIESQLTGVALAIYPVLGNFTGYLIFDDPGQGPFHNPRPITASVDLQEGVVYRWYHIAVQRFGAAPVNHTILWQKPSMTVSEPFNIGYFRPGPGPRAADEPIVFSSLNDRVPDQWKLANGIDPFNPDPRFLASGSLGGDGLTNWEKFVWGLPPLERVERPALGIRKEPAGNLSLSFPGLRHRRYVIEMSTDLETWTPLPDSMIELSDERYDLEWIFPGAAVERAFFRMIVEPLDAPDSLTSMSTIPPPSSGGYGSY